MTFDDLTDPDFRAIDLSDEELVIYQVASEALDSGDAEFALRVVQREADKDPRVHFRLFLSPAWPQPEVSPALWQQVLAEKGLR